MSQRWETSPVRSDKLRAAANGESCVACNAQDETIILAHLAAAGIADRGTGTKCDDFWGAHLCKRCHYEADHGIYVDDLFWRTQMVARTLRRLFKTGKLRAA